MERHTRPWLQPLLTGLLPGLIVYLIVAYAQSTEHPGTDASSLKRTNNGQRRLL